MPSHKSTNDPNNDSKKDDLKFYKLPGNIESAEYGNHYFELTSFYPITRKNEEALASDNIAPRFHVFLPVPPGLSTSYSVNYGSFGQTGWTALANREIDGLGNRINKVINAGSLTDGLGAVGEALSGGWKEIKSIATSPDVQLAVKGNIAGVLGDNFKAGYLRQSGGAVRNVETLAFDGVSVREWQFNWKIVPKNVDDLETLRLLKERMVLSMHPSGGDAKAFFFGYPNMFAFRVKSLNDRQESTMLPKSNPCFMTNFSIVYNGTGTPTFFKGTSEPVEYDITIALKETTALSRESFAGASDLISGGESSAAAEHGNPR